MECQTNVRVKRKEKLTTNGSIVEEENIQEESIMSEYPPSDGQKIKQRRERGLSDVRQRKRNVKQSIAKKQTGSIVIVKAGPKRKRK